MIYLKMEILLQKVDFGARYALHLILTIIYILKNNAITG